ncbi:MAG: WecB/TagA/CpsF family glycosyltransferase [Prevotellaceae bacterium]|jgi:N-acetylglucosaminyldiphosphoundecaprenol N-acetyl-beta-D-mannosaminyltransferase|nr:WecB/TagA/CpsF family glycosyltransferase [Prevotellaceae bacterium]
MLQLPSIDFLTIPVASVTMQQTIQAIDQCIQNNDHIQHVVINAGKVAAMQKDKNLYDSVVNCDLINADGQSVVWAVRFLGKYLPERVAGIDLMENLVALAHQKGYKCFFFGAKENVVRRVTAIYAEKYCPEIIAGYRNGYYKQDEEGAIARQIGESGANILFVAISSPQKEVFVNTYKDALLKVNFTMGVGGSFDVVAGIIKRAPYWMQNMGLEWFFRLIQEPGRMWRRYLIGNYRFIKLVFKAKFSKNDDETITHFWNPSGSH